MRDVGLRRVVFTAIFGMMLACSGPAQLSTAPSQTRQPPLASTTPSQSPRATEPSWPLKDMTSRPQVWFGPLDPPEWSQANNGSQSYDFNELFNSDFTWPLASDATRVMVLYPVWLDSLATIDQLRMVFSSLRERSIAIAFESGPLSEHGACNAGTVEGFSGASAASRIARRIRAAGGVLYAFEMEHGFDAATYYDPACRMTPEEIARDAAKSIAAVRSVFPDVVVGSIETADLDLDSVTAWLDAYKKVTGEELGFFHLDVNYHIPDWASRAKAIEDYVQARGIDFGIYYVGDPTDQTDAAWLEHASSRLTQFEVIQGGRPDHPIFQSWDAHPSHLLPEDQPGTFTHFVTSYLRPRSALTLTAGQSAISGVLMKEDGSPIPNAVIDLAFTPSSGQGVFADYTISGRVPAGATLGDVGLRINTECDCSGVASLALASVSYTEDGQTANPIPNGRFQTGLDGWGVWGSGQTGLSRGENGSGRALLLSAKPSQDVGVNSAGFAVHSGKSFTLTLRARVDPPTQSSGYFDIVFLGDGGEIQRFTTPIQVATVPAGTAQTKDDGSFELTLAAPPDASLSVTAWYPGDEVSWPAWAETERLP